MTVGRSTTCVMVLGLVLAASLPVRAQPELPLPTPRSHYETFTPGLSGLPLLQALTKGLDPQAQQAGLTLVTAFRLGNLGSTAQSKEQSVARLKGLNWRPWKPLLLEFAVHQSQAVELVPETSRAFFFPIVHGAVVELVQEISDRSSQFGHCGVDGTDVVPTPEIQDVLVNLVFQIAAPTRQNVPRIARALQDRPHRNPGRLTLRRGSISTGLDATSEREHPC